MRRNRSTRGVCPGRSPTSLGDREATVAIWTARGRFRKNADPRRRRGDLALLRTCKIGETDLVQRDGKWFLLCHHRCARSAADRTPVNGFVGVDLGIVNIAATSDGDRAAGARLNRYSKRQARLRKRLQATKTSSARRLLRKRRRKERRFATDVNHCVSKRIVAEAERTGRGIAVEQLGGIRDRVRLRKPQRATLHSWAFAQLGGFLTYKAQAAGVAFVQVDPAHTSQTSSKCGRVDKRNRRSQSVFECVRCGFVGHADHNAANNIAQRGVVRWGEVMRPYAAPTLTASWAAAASLTAPRNARDEQEARPLRDRFMTTDPPLPASWRRQPRRSRPVRRRAHRGSGAAGSSRPDPLRPH